MRAGLPAPLLALLYPAAVLVPLAAAALLGPVPLETAAEPGGTASVRFGAGPVDILGGRMSGC